MNSEDFQRLADAWIAGEISPEDSRRLDTALAENPDFAGLLAAQRSIDTQLRVILDEQNAGRRIVDSVIALLRTRSSEQFQSDFMREMAEHADRNGITTRKPVARRNFNRRAALAWSFAACFLIGFLCWQFLPGATIGARLAEIKGTVTLVRGSSRMPASVTTSLRAGDLVETAINGSAVLIYDGEPTRVALGEKTTLRFGSERRGKQFELKRGELLARAAHQPAGKPMLFMTPTGRAKVIGTTLSLQARRASTWLEVREGAVEFSRREGMEKITVESNQFAVAAPGLELSVRPVTPESHPGVPWPVKVPLFSDYVENSTWYISAESIRQTAVENAERPFKMPPLEGSLEFQTTVRVDEMIADQRPGDGSWGFGCIASFRPAGAASSAARNSAQPRQVIELDVFQNGFEGSLLRIVDPLTWRVFSSTPFQLPKKGTHHLKLRVEPAGAGEAGAVLGKIWEGNEEPEAWNLRAEITIQGPLSYVALSTHRSACTFTGMKAGLVE